MRFSLILWCAVLVDILDYEKLSSKTENYAKNNFRYRTLTIYLSHDSIFCFNKYISNLALFNRARRDELKGILHVRVQRSEELIIGLLNFPYFFTT